MKVKIYKSAAAALAAFIITGCSSDKAIQFCEGVDTEGKGVTCGKEFTTGDLTGVLTARQPFEAESISIKVLREEKGKMKVEKTMFIKVEREKKRASFDLTFLNGGTYTVEAYKENDKIGDGIIKIIDTY